MSVSRCPDCDYDLHGLPHTHKCPECGFPFDTTMTVFRPARPQVAWGGLILGVAIGAGGGALPIVATHQGDWRSVGAFEWFCLAFGAFVLFLCMRPLVPLGAWRYAVVHQDGLLARRGDRKYSLTWDDVRSVWLLPTMSVWLWLNRPPRLLTIRGVFERFDDARRLAGKVRTRVRMARRERAGARR